MDVFIKVRRRLNVANVVLFGTNLNEFLEITAKDHDLTINQTKFSSPEMRFKETSMRLKLAAGQDSLWFRVELMAGLEIGDRKNLEIIATPDFLPRSVLKAQAPELRLKEDYSIQCRTCSTILGRMKPERILPLPSSSWRQQTQNWFCCVNKLDAPPDISFKASDILFGPGLCVFREEIFDSDKIRLQDFKVKCECGLCLGVKIEDTFEIFSHSLEFVSSQDKTPLHPEMSSFLDNFVCILRARIEESAQIMPRFTCVDENGTKYHIWVVDKHLECYRSSIGETLDKEIVAKVVFTSGPSQQASDEVFINKQMMGESTEFFNNSCDNFPNDLKFINGSKVAYIKQL